MAHGHQIKDWLGMHRPQSSLDIPMNMFTWPQGPTGQHVEHFLMPHSPMDINSMPSDARLDTGTYVSWWFSHHWKTVCAVQRTSAPTRHSCLLKYCHVQINCNLRPSEHSQEVTCSPGHHGQSNSYYQEDCRRLQTPDTRAQLQDEDSAEDFTPTSLIKALKKVPEIDQWHVVAAVISTDDDINLAKGIIQGTACPTTEMDPTTIPMSYNPTPIPPTAACLLGLPALFNCTVPLRTSTQHHMSSSITLGLDGKAGLNSAAGNFPPHPSQANFDLLVHVRKMIQQLLITARWHWVKGHQDKRRYPPSSHMLDPWAWAQFGDLPAQAIFEHRRGQQNCAP
jgi:hypothetical protein